MIREERTTIPGEQATFDWKFVYTKFYGVPAERTRFDLANACAFFEYNYSIRKTLDIIYRSGLESALFESVKRIMLPDRENDDWYRERFYSYGLFGLLDGWIRRGYSETPQQMAELITAIV